MRTITAEIEVDFKDGRKKIEMQLKETYEIDDCEMEKVIVLNLCNGEMYTGIFKGMDGDDIMIGSISGKNTIGLSVDVINDYFEQI